MTTTFRIAALSIAAAAAVACTSTVVRTTPGATRASPARSVPKPGVTAKVQRGDTLYGIAFRNGLDVRDLAAWNGIGPPYTIYPGQSLRLYPRKGSAPAPGRAVTAAPDPSVASGRPASQGTTGAGTPTTPATIGKPPATAARPSGLPATTGAPVAKPPAVQPPAPVASNITWHWPAEGQLLNRFVAGEPTRQGIDIVGAGGTPVRAAADGVVVYSGAGLVGYGELIIVKHDDAWLSAYGHNRARMVNEGAIVKAGQQIAVMGRTGAPRDMLHFEIRYNGKPVDPLAHLPER